MSHLLENEAQGFVDIFGSARGPIGKDTLTEAHAASRDADYDALNLLAASTPSHHLTILDGHTLHGELLNDIQRGCFARTLNILNGQKGCDFEHVVFDSLLDEMVKATVPVESYILMTKLLTRFWQALLPKDMFDSAMSSSRNAYTTFHLGPLSSQLAEMLKGGHCKQPDDVKKMHIPLTAASVQQADIHSGNPSIRILNDFVTSPLVNRVTKREEDILGKFTLLTPLNNAGLLAQLSGEQVRPDDEEQSARKYIIWEHVVKVMWDEVARTGGEEAVDESFVHDLLALMF